jgi:hypothetical protein
MMNAAETRLVEEGWTVLVERLGLAEATRFVMLLDRRSGSALQHMQYLRSGAHPTSHRRNRETMSHPRSTVEEAAHSYEHYMR